ncbi:hypothetical protein APED_06520 [Acanthopleuribacter pedis]
MSHKILGEILLKDSRPEEAQDHLQRAEPLLQI